MIRNIYGFTDSGKKVKIGEYDDGLNPVGGRIFYIDPNSDETVEFYDANGDVISNVIAGDTPAYYKVTSAGVSGKEKYFIYDSAVVASQVSNTTWARWTYYENGAYVNEIIDNLPEVGKGNTALIMALHDGAYVTDDSDGKPTIWYKIQQWNLAQLNGCNDWYIGSLDEVAYLSNFIRNNGGTIDVDFPYQVHTSSPSPNFSGKTWYFNNWSSSSNADKYYICAAIPIRSF